MDNTNITSMNKTASFKYDDALSSEEIHLRDYWRIVLRRKWMIIAFFFVTVIMITIYTFKQKPVYQGVATIRIYKEAPKILSFEEVVNTDIYGYGQEESFYNTECEVLKSRSLAERVIRKLHLDRHPEFVSDETKQEWKDQDIDETMKMKILVDVFLSKMDIQHIRNSELVKIKMKTNSPELSARIANTLAEEYVDKNLEDKVLITRGATEEIQKQLAETKRRLEESEKRLYAYAQENDIVAMKKRQSVILNKIEDIAEKLTEAEADRIAREVQFLQLQNNGISALNLMSSNSIGELGLTHAELTANYVKELSRFKDGHPELISLKKQIDFLEDKIRTIIRTAYLEAIGREKALRQHLEELKRENNLLEEKSIGYRVLERDMETNIQLYEGLLQRMKEAAVSSEIKTTNIQIVDRAVPPSKPIKPRKKLNILLSMIVGLTMGVCIAFFFEYLDNTIKGPDDIEQHLKVPLFGIVSKIDTENKSLSDTLILKNDPRSIAAEAIRNIRTSLLFSFANGNRGRLILTSSTVPWEGKSFFSSNIAIAMAEAGKKVLLVDTDLRKPSLNRYFNVRREPGITNFLVGEDEIESVIQDSIFPNLSFIACGPIPPNPSELLGSPKMEEFLKMVSDRFDWVFLDSPPEISVTDANILNNMVDGTILVIESGRTSRDYIRKTISRFNEIQPKVIGAVLNMLDITKQGYYYHSYYYKYKYYEEEKEATSV